MTAKAKYRLVVVFEDELRLAARLLRDYFDDTKRLEAADVTSLFEACHCALQGADDEGAVLMLGRKPEIVADRG